VIRVLCTEPYCRRWATFYTTQADKPEHTRVEHGIARGALLTFWYACAGHKGPTHQPLAEGAVPPVCEHCGSTDQVAFTHAATAYHHEETVWDINLYGPGNVPNPNRDLAFCPECTTDYHDIYAEMWAEYRSSQGI